MLNLCQNETTHVLNPCQHVVCDNCFDGSNYSACPICEHHVDTGSPFFKSSLAPKSLTPPARFKLLDLCLDVNSEAKNTLQRLCLRTQALSDDDNVVLAAIVKEYFKYVLDWLPEKIPLRENIAVVFGNLLKHLDATAVLDCAKRYMSTATDILRLIAVYSGSSAALQQQTIIKEIQITESAGRFWSQIAKLFGQQTPDITTRTAYLPQQIYRFKVGKLSRSLRRSVLSFLNDLPTDRLLEDMLRHQSYWVWLGEFLHPGEYKSGFPMLLKYFCHSWK